ncbi:MAG: SUMF1/EgtB/PvdO family nonheme iron enzyme [Ideonella sp.]|nr:SUMF1/EgtB/PvdO family nonheme iron enzyme [Ideonella sp.]
MPSEDEWEYAARATRWTEERQWDSGSNGGKENCTYAASNNCTGSNPDPVAKTGRKPNAWGLYDMIGNVWEWTATPGGSGRVVRGGSFDSNDDYLRLSARYAYTPGRRNDGNGVRVFARIDL